MLIPLFTDPASSRCSAWCTAASYQLKALFDALKGRYRAASFRDVVHFDLTVAPHAPSETKDAFCFAYGVVVFWGLSEAEEQQFLGEVKEFEQKPLSPCECDTMHFAFGSVARIAEEEIELPDHDLLSRLAISHGLAQSVRLSTFENIIQKTIDKTKSIPEQLAVKGKIPLSKREIRRKMGELFLERSSVNLHSDILDVPEFFWDHSDIEPLYSMIASHLELEGRIEVLNQRLDIVHDLFEMLGNELNHQHSSKLEWIIIWLIVIEVTLTLLRDFVKMTAFS